MVPIIIPTNKCNLRCKHCLRSNYAGEEMRLEDLRKFLEGFEEYHLGNEFSITGGEFTLYDNFSAMFEMLRDHGFRGSVVTNGQDVEKISKLCDFKSILNYVLISLEGHNSFINDKVRGVGSFDKAMETIRILKKNQITVVIRTTLNSISIDYIEEMIDFSVSIGVTKLEFSTVFPCEKGKKNDLMLNQEKMEEGYQKYNKLIGKYPNFESSYALRNFKNSTDPEWRSFGKCRPIALIPYHRGELVLRPDGLVSFCCDLADYDFYSENYEGTNKNRYNHILGDIRKEDFGIILERRRKLVDKLIKRRLEDVKKGELKGRRRFICENCKFYFFYEK
jgi:MoaA/NifB/PqqE/SkfB family radical SAM enzyme